MPLLAILVLIVVLLAAPIRRAEVEAASPEMDSMWLQLRTMMLFRERSTGHCYVVWTERGGIAIENPWFCWKMFDDR